MTVEYSIQLSKKKCVTVTLHFSPTLSVSDNPRMNGECRIDYVLHVHLGSFYLAQIPRTTPANMQISSIPEDREMEYQASDELHPLQY
jgi:hypothetical protein